MFTKIPLKKDFYKWEGYSRCIPEDVIALKIYTMQYSKPRYSVISIIVDWYILTSASFCS